MKFRVQRKQKIIEKTLHEGFNKSTQQQAQLNLIQISNLDFIAGNEDGDPEKVESRPAIKTRAKQLNMPFIRTYYKSTELRKSVTEKMTQSFKAGRRASCSELHTDQVCVIKRKLPLSLSNFIVLGEGKEEKDRAEPGSPSTYRPRPCINTRTYYRKREESRKEEEFNWTQRPKYQARKLYPFQESYWRIYKP